MGMDTLVELVNVSVRMQDRLLLDQVNFSIRKGKVTLLMGPSGCGKSTLLCLITGQLKPDSGEVWVRGQPMHQLTGQALLNARFSMGMLFQNGALFSDLDVFENVAYPVREHIQVPEDMLHDWVVMRLETVGLRGAARLMPYELSGGMVRRVALARAMMLDPQLLLYDEPLTGQDPISVGVLCRLIQTFNQMMGLTSLIVSHQLSAVQGIVDEVLMVVDQQVMACGSPTELGASKNPKVQQFVAGSPDGAVPFHYPAGSLAKALL